MIEPLEVLANRIAFTLALVACFVLPMAVIGIYRIVREGLKGREK